jgi:hypothetical protein
MDNDGAERANIDIRLEDIRRIALREGEVLVVRIMYSILSDYEHIQKRFQSAFPKNKVIVVYCNDKFEAIQPEDL